MIMLSLDIPKMNEGGVSATFDSTPFPKEKACFALFFRGRYLEFRHRQVRLFVLSPETTDPRVPDDVHWWHPRIL